MTDQTNTTPGGSPPGNVSPADREWLTRFQREQAKIKLLRRAMDWSGVIALFLIVGWWLKLIAGKSTYFELLTSIAADIKLDRAVAWIEPWHGSSPVSSASTLGGCTEQRKKS